MRCICQSSSSYSQMGMRYIRVLPRSSMRHRAAAPGLLRPMWGPAWSQLASAHSDDSSLYSTWTAQYRVSHFPRTPHVTHHRLSILCCRSPSFKIEVR